MAPGSTEMITHMKRNASMAMAVMILLGAGMIGLGRAQDDEGPMSALRFVVVRDSDGKPVRNAEVVLHPVKRKGKQAKEIECESVHECRRGYCPWLNFRASLAIAATFMPAKSFCRVFT